MFHFNQNIFIVTPIITTTIRPSALSKRQINYSNGMQLTSTTATGSIVIDDLLSTTTTTIVAGMDNNRMTQLSSNYTHDMSTKSPSRRDTSKRRGYYHPLYFDISKLLCVRVFVLSELPFTHE